MASNISTITGPIGTKLGTPAETMPKAERDDFHTETGEDRSLGNGWAFNGECTVVKKRLVRLAAEADYS